MSLEPEPSKAAADSRPRIALQTIVYILLGLTAAWFLLRELAPVLRPLLIAVMIGYVVMPYHSRLSRRLSGPLSILVIIAVSAGVLLGLGFATYVSVLGLSDELPRLEARAVGIGEEMQRWTETNVPWLEAEVAEGERATDRLTRAGPAVAGAVLNLAADVLIEAAVVILYLFFLLLGAAGLPDRLRAAYSPERADEILHIAGQVNSAIVSYLRAKVKSSLFLAVPVGLILWMFGVRFALLWGVLTFLCNFIPYIGSIIAYSLPVGFAFLQLDLDWRPITVAILLLGCHAGSASIVEPMLLGKAVGLSPMMILLSLGFWGLLWGIPGMLLAVPLTVVVVIVMDHFDSSRPIARLVSGS
jgi:AI-2 transport protein TqsA